MSAPILPERAPNRRPDGPPAARGHLERLIGHYAELTGVAPDRVRRWVSVMVLLGALDRVGEEEMPRFLLKGGIAIELRFGTDARATKDVDLVFFGDPQVLEEDLDAAFDRDYSQFAFQRQQIEQMPGTPFHRLSVKLLYRGRSWATLKLEVAPPDARGVDREPVPAIDIAEFGLDGPEVVQCLSTRFQVAQKIHAVTERFEARENERFRDLIDLLLLREIVEDLSSLRDACIVTFKARRKHGWPPQLSVPDSWAEPYRALAGEMQFPVADVDDAADAVRAFNLNGGAVFKNQGTYNFNAEPYPTWVHEMIRNEGGGSGRFVNRGTFQRTEGKINVKVLPEFENHGVIKEQSSKIEIENPVTAEDEFGKHCKEGDPVDCATGDFSESQTDFAISGRGIGLELTRTYSAQAAAAAASAGSFGYGWTGSFSDHLIVEESGVKVTLTRGDGSTVPFTRISGTTYSGPAWSQETLSGSPEAGYTFTRTDQTQLHFSGAGRLESVVDRNGNTTTLSYDEAGRLKEITDPAGRQIALAYNEGGQVKSAEDPMGNLVKYAYEGGNLTSVTMPGEESPRWQFKYDASHRITTITDGRSGKTTNEYDSSNRVVSQTDPAGRTLAFEYNSFHTKITNKATGAVTDEWFTSDNEPFSITRGYGTAVATTETFSYNDAGQLLSITDGNGHTTTYGYDAAGNKTSEKDAAGNEAKWTYNTTHDIVSMTTPNGEKTTITRDSHGNPETISRPGPGETTQTTSFKYDEHGQLKSVTDPLERTWTYGYDSQGDRTSETGPTGDTGTLGYDENSHLTSIVSPRGNVEGAEAAEYTTTIERDAQRRPLKVTDPLSHATEYAYDGDGNLLSKTDAKGHTTKYTYDADNEQTKIEKPNGAVLETGYDGAGQITSQTDGNKRTTKYVRNALGLPVEVIDPLERKTIEEFDGAGNLKSITDPAERKTSYSYDPSNQLTKVSYSDGKTPTVEYEYDADGNVIHTSDGSGESSYSYDRLDRLTQTEDGHGSVVGYEYDLADELTAITYPNGKSVSRSFDKAGRLESVTDWLSGTTTFAYNADSDLGSITFPEGTSNVDEYAYDRADGMNEGKFTAGTEALASFSYSRDKVGQIEKEIVKGLPGPEELTYSYDKNDRLIGAGSASYEYDAADNLTKAPGTTNTYDAASQLEAGTGVTYSYDKLGERTKATPEAGSATSFGYDQAGNLISVERPEEGEVPAIGESFAYDGTGVMTSKTSGLTTNYLTWDQVAELPLILSDGQNSYIYGPNGLPVEQIDSEETPTYLHHDQLGSTRMLTNAKGEATGTFSYAPYGGLEGSTGTATTLLGFASQYTDPQSGLQYLRARFYDPSTGQFLTRDPMEAITRQPYSYVDDQPINTTDPSGLCGLSSLGDVGDCFNPISRGNLAYQGAQSIYHSVGSLPAPSARDMAETEVGFFDGGTFGLTKYARDLLGIGNGGLELCSSYYDWSQIAGLAVSSFFLPEASPLSLELAARYPKASAWVVEHGDVLIKIKDTAEEIIKTIVGVR